MIKDIFIHADQIGNLIVEKRTSLLFFDSVRKHIRTDNSSLHLQRIERNRIRRI